MVGQQVGRPFLTAKITFLMKKQLLNVCVLAVLALGSSSCKKVYDDKSLAPLDQAYATIPVTVTNANYFERFYVIEAKGAFNPPATPGLPNVATNPTAAQPGNFSITFSIPADKGKIKEITRVTTGGAGLAWLQSSVLGTPVSLAVGAPKRVLSVSELALNFNGNTTIPGTQPVVGNGTNTITYTSSLFEYLNYRNRLGPLLDSSTGLSQVGFAPLFSTIANIPTQVNFYFLITLEDGTTIIPPLVRVRII